MRRQREEDSCVPDIMQVMESDTKYTVLVMQSGVDPKDIYISQTAEDPVIVVDRYNSTENPKILPKPLGKMLPLSIRPDLARENNVFTSQAEAIEYRRVLSEQVEKQTFRYNLRSKRSLFFGKKKSIKNKQTGEYALAIDPSQMKLNDNHGRTIGYEVKDAFSYGRKKSNEWNDKAASNLEETLRDKIKQQLDQHLD